MRDERGKRRRLKPKTDVVFRLLFGNNNDPRPLLALVNAILGWDEPLVEIVVSNADMGGERAEEKTPLLDLRARDGRGWWYNIEVQLTPQDNYCQRALYYWSKVYSAQLSRGEGYSKLRPTIGIHFLDWIMDGEGAPEGYWGKYVVQDGQGRVLTNHLELHMIQMPALDKDPRELDTARERWIYFIRDGHRLTDEQVKAMGDDIKYADRKLAHISEEERLWHLQDSIEKAERDRLSRYLDQQEARQAAAEAERRKQEAERRKQEAEQAAAEAEQAAAAAEQAAAAAEQAAAEAERQHHETLLMLVEQGLGRHPTEAEGSHLRLKLKRFELKQIVSQVMGMSAEEIAAWLGEP